MKTRHTARNAILLAGLIVVLLLAGGPLFATGKAEQGQPQGQQEETLGVAKEEERLMMVSIPKLRSPWFNDLEAGLRRAGQEYGVNVYQQAPASADEAQQVRLIEDAINQGVNAILVVPNDANSIVPAFARAQAQGIATLTHESPNQQNADFDVEMIDNVAFGQKSMDLMVQAMGAQEGQFVIFVGSLTVPAHNIWADAALEQARQNYPGLRQVADRYPVSEDQSLARQTALDILTANPDIRAFLCFGSQGAPGAAQAVRERGLSDRVAVIGTTSPMQAAQYLQDGSMDYAVVWRPGEAGYAMVYLARLVLEGRQAEVTEGFEIPTIGAPIKIDGNTLIFDRPLVIDRENVGTFDF
jgi:simple sugar transport system substrate-binding protein